MLSKRSLAGAAGLCAALLLLALPGPLPAQTEEPKDNETPETMQELKGKVSLALNTGGHADPIGVMTFTPDGKKLITARASEVIVWNVATGERERVWRLPTAVGCLAVAPNSKTVAAAGGLDTGKTRTAPVWMLPLPAADKNEGGEAGDKDKAEMGKVHPLHLKIPDAVSTLAFAPKGNRLAWGTGATAAVYDLKAKTTTHVINHPKGNVERLIFSKDGNQLLVALSHVGGATAQRPPPMMGRFARRGFKFEPPPPVDAPPCEVWDVSLPAKPGPQPATPTRSLYALDKCDGPAMAWSADNKHFALLRGPQRGLRLWAGNDRKEKDVDGKVLLAEFQTGWWNVGGIQFLGTSNRLVAAVAHWGGDHPDETATVVAVEPSGKIERLYRGPVQEPGFFRMAASTDGKLLALTGDPGYDVILFDVERKQEGRRLGLEGHKPQPAPRFVGWSKDGTTIGWGFNLEAKQPRASALVGGLNLATLEPLVGGQPAGTGGEQPAQAPADWITGKWNSDNWKVVTEPGSKRKDSKAGVVLSPARGKPIETPIEGWLNAWTMYKAGKDKHDRLAVAVHDDVVLYDVETNKVLQTIRIASAAEDLAVSADGKYLLIAAGRQFVQLFRIDGAKPEQLLKVLVAGPDWVAWTPQGYYAATPGGEKLIGWRVKHDDNSPLAFYPAERFRKLFYKPDVIRHLLTSGSVAETLKVTKTRDVDVNNVLPPHVTITAVMEIKAGAKSSYVVKAKAEAGSKDEPVESMRLLLDGRALAGAKIKQSQPDEAEWTIAELPGGHHELKVLARCPDVSGVSEVHVIDTPLPAADKPLLYRVCVGVNDYDQPGLKLGSAKLDAEAVFDALEKYCTDKGGKDNRFRAAAGVVLVDKKATRQAVLDALKDVRKAKVKPGDLVVLFFAGHGVVQKGEFYLLTREADTGKDLKGQSLSGKDLQEAFADMPCSVLLIMDACHSGAAVGALQLKPATDDLTRALTDDQVAVTVLAAAMGYETAGERPGHGFFTEALLKGLEAGAGVPYDPHDKQMYVHHLFSHVFSEVRRTSQGKQNPFLNMPWTVPPLALRDVLAK
jgi:hypothetical protein